ncbi:fasciclin domain-containing protein [Spirosoma validum]|uniref:Fasciclin domain-containing protein n=1 Tax=Spirosoma validum TaxID=2771355 RepID=A0A927B993_9BACT|nr:fasciclin domain-containing protein [Spirosoma validum]MBD2757603.1 fasciclin domain-containing protein [Spirosoma validum]
MLQSIHRYFQQSTFLLLFAATPFFYSCTTNTPDPDGGTTPPTSGTVTNPGSGTTTNPGSGTTTNPGSGTAIVLPTVDFINQKSNLTLLKAAITRSGISSEFSKGNITVFAPSDDAFKAAGYANEAAVSAAPAAALERILRYHIINSRVDRSSIPAGVNTVYQTSLASNVVSVFKTSLSDISVNQAKITEGDNATTNSVVHIINQVLMPSTSNLTALIKGNTSLSLLSAAIDRAGSSTQDLLNKSTQNGYTLFAPTNDAFKAAGYADEAAIKAADQKKISDLLLYHLLNYQAFTQTFQNGADIVTAQGASIRTNVSSGKVTILGKGNGTNAANVTQADQIASNGVVHIIDRVLLIQ